MQDANSRPGRKSTGRGSTERTEKRRIQSLKKEIPKRLRLPPKKDHCYQAYPDSPKDGMEAYIMHCSMLPGWTPVEKSKLKKALINKCRARAVKSIVNA